MLHIIFEKCTTEFKNCSIWKWTDCTKKKNDSNIYGLDDIGVIYTPERKAPKKKSQGQSWILSINEIVNFGGFSFSFLLFDLVSADCIKWNGNWVQPPYLCPKASFVRYSSIRKIAYSYTTLVIDCRLPVSVSLRPVVVFCISTYSSVIDFIKK